MRNGSIFGGDLGGEWIWGLLFVFCGSGSRHAESGVGEMTDIYVLKPRVTACEFRKKKNLQITGLGESQFLCFYKLWMRSRHVQETCEGLFWQVPSLIQASFIIMARNKITLCITLMLHVAKLSHTHTVCLLVHVLLLHSKSLNWKFSLLESRFVIYGIIGGIYHYLPAIFHEFILKTPQ